MKDPQVHKLVRSANPGRFSLDTPNGPDISSDSKISIYIGGEWVSGRVEYDQEGYYFVALVGGTCGLRTGMEVMVR